MTPHTITIQAVVTNEDIGSLLCRAGWPNYQDIDLQQKVAELNGYDTIQSFHFRIKQGEEYIVPSFEDNELDVIEAETLANSPKDDNKSYTLRLGENIWSTSRKFNIPVDELLEHNDIEDPKIVVEGYTLHLPTNKSKGIEMIYYELLEQPKELPVTNPGGAYKYHFGNVKKWIDFARVGHLYPEGTMVRVVAIAHVPVPEDGKKAAYFLDDISLGTYRENGKIAHATGFNWRHLQHETPKEEVKPEPVVEEVKEPIPVGTDWKESYTPFVNPVTHFYRRDMTIKDLETRRPDVYKEGGNGTLIAGTFERDGHKYYRPFAAVEAGSWYGIPEGDLMSENERHKRTFTLEERIAMHGRLTKRERLLSIPMARAQAKAARLRQDARKLKNK